MGQFVAGGCTGTQDTICSNETVCLAGEYEIAAPTETSDRDCDACAVCPMGSYEATGCCDNHDTVCETMLVCEDDEFESTAPIAAEQVTYDTLFGTTQYGPGWVRIRPSLPEGQDLLSSGI